MKKFLLIVLPIMLLVSCTTQTSTTEQIALNILEKDSKADIFIFNDRIYKKNDSAASLNEDHLNKVGEITKNYKKGVPFENGVATTLPIGTKIYSQKQSKDKDELYIKTEEGFFKYIAEVEG
ncbi:hypothetical protein CU633_22215 [Bacillus sp. V3-13]|uniref:hypothetical protein n=1 Tax=Bacillus sp. V3-13 TaxID=2053728 RepID=UPI000C766996|nr:hypothetical protein [Bacillus sp. V3-13]PLR75233.1 hypothetical protein CU633_22215 [Bacillus sp. V3-13]